jgi:putative transposase
MARQARLIESGIAFHITARGNYRQTVFFSEEDRAEYLDLLARCAAAEDLEILGWRLMTNHAHLLAVPRKTTSLARTMRAHAGRLRAAPQPPARLPQRSFVAVTLLLVPGGG